MIGWEDVWMGNPVDQMNLCLEIVHNPLHLFERQPLERNLLQSGKQRVSIAELCHP